MTARRRWAHALVLAALLALAAPAHPRAGTGEDGALPRFASLRSDKVNLRAGPGKQYPVEWVFLRRALPVEIVAEYGQWRKIRDIDGSEGWVHRSLLSSKRWVMIAGAVRTLRRKPEPDAAPVLRAEPGVLARLLSCRGAWCRVEIAEREGWLLRDQIWGVYPAETVE